jgi:hypothetical protein
MHGPCPTRHPSSRMSREIVDHDLFSLQEVGRFVPRYYQKHVEMGFLLLFIKVSAAQRQEADETPGNFSRHTAYFRQSRLDPLSAALFVITISERAF